jgi:hypothetical protein
LTLTPLQLDFNPGVPKQDTFRRSFTDPSIYACANGTA